MLSIRTSAAARAVLGALWVANTAAAPCDIYAAGNAPCVAAHSTTRALYAAYKGPLYQVQRGSDSTLLDITPLSAGGVANAAAQDSFCSGTTCLITTIYDQSPSNNHLTRGLVGGWDGPDVGSNDNLASAVGAPVILNGQKAYGVFIPPGTGYRIDNGNNTATGDGPEGIYAVLDGTHYNDGCCFDYGNAETDRHADTNGGMEAIYFGNSSFWGTGSGPGPWIMADLEGGLFSGADPAENSADTSLEHRFVTAIVKGQPNQWAIRGADATSGGLTTYYSGARPNAPGYNPMSKQGSIVLGIGGDNSPHAQGTFYEGAITATYPSDAVEDQIQADIAAAKYATTSLVSGPAVFNIGQAVTFRVTTPGFNTRYIVHDGANVVTQVVSSSDPVALQQQASFIVRTGLGNSGCYSFESADTSGSFIRHSGFELYLNANDGTKLFYEDATYCPMAGLNGQGNSIRSWSFPTRFFRHYSGTLFVASNGGVNSFDVTSSYNDDTSFVVGSGFSQ